jgi:hypothetical protein
MQVLTAKFAQIDATIEAKNAQIATLQAEVTELQEHRQQLLSVEQACTSALSQFDTAIAMLTHVDSSEIATFKDALLAKFDNNVIGFLEPAAPAAPAPEPEPISPDAPVGDAVKPKSDAPIDVQVSAEPEPTTAPAPKPVPDVDIEQALAKMPLPSLRMLAKSKSVDARGTKANLAARLKTITTNADIRALG